jgi:NAD-dependent SIR2 family protein deacetylase
MYERELERAAEAVRSAEALLIGAGAGMSVDAGIPAYRLNPPSATGEPAPPLGSLNPMLFTAYPAVAWGRAAVQRALFRRTVPHRGYQLLLEWSQRMPAGAFVITSNIDGMFLAAGFAADRVVEGHGSMHFMQCTRPCTPAIWSAETCAFELDEARQLAPSPPTCRDCGAPARPNVFMFGDRFFNSGRAEEQLRSFDAWQEATRPRRFAVIECGAGTAVPTIRDKCHAFARQRDVPLVRINPAESDPEEGVIGIPLDARTALERIQALLAVSEWPSSNHQSI